MVQTHARTMASAASARVDAAAAADSGSEDHKYTPKKGKSEW